MIPGINKIGKRRDGNTSSGIEENGGGDEQQNLMNEPMKKMKAPMPKEADTTTMKDAPKAKEGMKAVVKTKQVTENKRYLQTKPGSLEEAVLKTRGLVK